MHRHEFTELVFITGGTGTHAVDKTHYTLSTGDFFVINASQRHAYQNPQQLQLINIMLRHRFMEQHQDSLMEFPSGSRLFGHSFFRPHPLNEEGLACALRLIERIEQEAAGRSDGSVTMQSALLLELLVTVCRLIDGPPAKADSVQPRINQALAHMDRHFSTPLTLPEVEAVAHMSTRSFHRHFLSLVGMQPMQYLQRVRILHACRLLHETERSVQVIATECGIPDTAYFCQLFRRRIGTTPSQFRKQRTA